MFSRRRASEGPSKSDGRRSGAQAFKLAPLVSNKDHLSTLNADCLLLVFTFLDHTTLDVIATVNQRLHPLSTQARPKASKGAIDLQLSMGINVKARRMVEYTATLTYGDGWSTTKRFTTDRTRSTCRICEDFSQSQTPRCVTPALHSMFTRISVLQKRYYFSKITFESFSFDLDLLTLCEKILDLEQNAKRVFSNVSLDILSESRNSADNFRKWLTEGGTREIEITTDGMIHELNPASFMEEFSNAVDNPSLSVISTLHHAQVECMDYHYRSRYIHTPHSWKPPFEKFVTLRLDYLIIPSDLIMKIIMLRFNKNIAGDWRVRTSSKLDLKMIRGDLQHNMMCDRNHGGASFTVRYRKRDVMTIENLESNTIFILACDHISLISQIVLNARRF